MGAARVRISSASVAKTAVVLGELDDLLHDSPIVVVDVGARGGIAQRWQLLEPWVHAIGFEPDPRSNEVLDQSERFTVIPTALASRAGTITLNQTAEEGDSSVLTPNRAFLERFPGAERFEVTGTVTLEADTLDNQLARGGIERVDFVKLDTQGTELTILEGAQETLRRGVFGIEVEVQLNPMYEGAALLADVDRFLRPFGYELFDLDEPRRWKYLAGEDLALTRGQLIWADATYLLGPDRALPFLSEDGSVNAESLARAVVICLVYGLGDYALWLLDALGETVDPPLRDRLVRAVRAYDAGAKSGRYRLSTRATAGDMRRVHRLSQQTGLKPSKQLRSALGAWLDEQEGASS